MPLNSLAEVLSRCPLIEISSGNYKQGDFWNAQHFDTISAKQLQELFDTHNNLCFLNGISQDVERNKRVGNKSIVEKNIITFDIDFKDSPLHGPAFLQLPPETKLQTVVDVYGQYKGSLTEKIGVPWLAVFTGNGLHLHYKLDEPIKIEPKAYSALYMELLKTVSWAFGADYPIDDACKNCGRIMRLPGSLNSKPGATEAWGKIIECNENSWLDSVISEIYRENENERQHQARTGQIAVDINSAWGAGENAEEDLKSHYPPDHHKENIKEALDFRKIFNHFNTTIHNEKSDGSGQIWISSPWRRSGKPISESSPSLAITNDGKWHCHSTGKGGDLFALIGEFAKLDWRTQFKEILEVAEKITGISKPKSNVRKLENFKAPDTTTVRAILASIPDDVDRIELIDRLQPAIRILANGTPVYDETYLQLIQERWILKTKVVDTLRKQLDDMREEVRENLEAKPQEDYSNDDLINPKPYYKLFGEDGLNIKHELLSGSAVIYSGAKQEIAVGGNLPYSLTPATISFCGNKEYRSYLEGIALTTPGVQYQHVHRMLSRWLKDVKKPIVLIKKDIAVEPYEGLMNSALGQIIGSFNIDEVDTQFRFTKLEIVRIYTYCLAIAHLRQENNNIRPIVPVLVSTSEDVGKDTAIATMIFHWHPYVKKVSFGKGSQEKELQRAFATSYVQHIEEFEKIADMNPAFIRGLFSGDYSDTTLKGDNETTRLYYRGIALGSANSCGFLTPGADNSRFIPIIIDSIEKSAYKPCIHLSEQIFAQTRAKALDGSYQLDDNLLAKIKRIQAYYSGDNEGSAFVDVFKYFLDTDLLPGLSFSERDEILERCVITNEECTRLGVFLKFQERYPAYRQLTEYGFRKLLKAGGWYDPTRVFKVGDKSAKGIKLPEQYRAKPQRLGDIND